MVEFLYEENGGIPGDLVLPTIEGIKEELSKFLIAKIIKGKTSCSQEDAQKIHLPENGFFFRN